MPSQRPPSRPTSRAETPRLASRIGRVAGFLALPAVNALMPLLVLPTITANLGQSAWATVAVAQSVAAACATLVDLGWGLSGSQRSARQARENRAQLSLLSILSRMLVFGPVVVIASIVVTLLVPGEHIAAVGIVIAGSLSGVGVTWAFIGLGRPSLILLVDTLPRMAFLVGAVVMISLGGSLVWYAGALLGAAAVSVGLGAFVIGVRIRHITRYSLRRVVRATWMQRSAALARGVSALYFSLPTAFVAAVAPVGVTASFGAAQRMQQLALSALVAVSRIMQNWVGRLVDPRDRDRRALRAILVSASIGLACGGAYAVLAPTISDFLFSGAATVSYVVSAVSGLTVAIVTTSYTSGNVGLVSVHRVDAIAWSAIAGAVVGVPLILVGASEWGVLGGVAGVAAAELAVLAVQLTVFTRSYRRRSDRDSGAGEPVGETSRSGETSSASTDGTEAPRPIGHVTP